MIDLRGALLAAAEEAEKLQQESAQNKAMLDDTRNWVNEIYNQNYELKKKLKAAGELMQQMAETLISAAEI